MELASQVNPIANFVKSVIDDTDFIRSQLNQSHRSAEIFDLHVTTLPEIASLRQNFTFP
jgi:hypothetical protein